MRVIGVSSTGGDVQFEADGQPIESDVTPWKMGSSANKLATAVAGAATLNKMSGQVTSESLTTAAGADYTLTVTNSKNFASDFVFASVQNGSNTAGDPGVLSVTPAAGSLVIKVRNHHATVALNGTLLVSFITFRF